MNINKNRIRYYNSNDPRYGFTISDGKRFTRDIYPLHLKKYCNESEDFNEFMDSIYPPISRCWSQGYENCTPLNIKSNNHFDRCGCSRCDIRVYDKVSDTISWKKYDEFNRKNLNPNSMYDQSRIPIDNNDNIIIDNWTPNGLAESPNKKKKMIKYKKKETSIEGFDSRTSNSLVEYPNKKKKMIKYKKKETRIEGLDHFDDCCCSLFSFKFTIPKTATGGCARCARCARYIC
jgi:hypothetical protein